MVDFCPKLVHLVPSDDRLRHFSRVILVSASGSDAADQCGDYLFEKADMVQQVFDVQVKTSRLLGLQLLTSSDLLAPTLFVLESLRQLAGAKSRDDGCHCGA